jgi:hypothetical protein
VPDTNPLPTMVSAVPPAVGPVVGVSELKVGTPTFAKRRLLVWPPTVTSTGTEGPVSPPGDAQTNCVWLCDVTTQARPSTVTLAPVLPKLEPLSTSDAVPEGSGSGLMLDNTGAKRATLGPVVDWPPAVTVTDSPVPTPAGTSTCSWLSLWAVTGAGTPPTCTVAVIELGPKFAPEMVSG